MKFANSLVLYLLLLIPFLIAGYSYLITRKHKALKYSSLGIVKQSLANSWGSLIKRHIPAVFMLLAVSLLGVAAAGPQTSITLPFNRPTIILALDVSGSMGAEDIKPNRMDAMTTAVKEFISEQDSARIGLVPFDGHAYNLMEPTASKTRLLFALNGLQIGDYTAIGEGMLVSLQQIFPEMDFTKPIPEPVKPGTYSTAIIVVLTDGQNTFGVDPKDVARIAADLGVKVFTIGYGTDDPSMDQDGFSVNVAVDETTLKLIADVTKGEYFKATNSDGLKKVYQEVSSRLFLEKHYTDVTYLFCFGAFVLMFIGAVCSLLWSTRW